MAQRMKIAIGKPTIIKKSFISKLIGSRIEKNTVLFGNKTAVSAKKVLVSKQKLPYIGSNRNISE